MRICFPAVAALVPLVGGVKHGTAATATSCSSISTWPQPRLEGNLLQAVDEVDAGPDPFFADLAERVPNADKKSEIDEAADDMTLPKRTYIVEVYENEARGIARRWRDLRLANSLSNQRWTYKDGSTALSPSEIRPPDDWDWVSEWKIDRSGERDIGGWEYTRESGKFDSLRAPRSKQLTDRYRRRRWIRAMRPQWGRLQQETNEVGLKLEELAETTIRGAPALHVHAYDNEAEGFWFDSGRDMDVDLLPAPDVEHLSDRSRTSLSVPGIGHAVTAVKGWWTDEFTFRGFGIGIVKPIFRGMLLRPDVGIGIRLPLTLHFRSWETQEALPAISASFFVLWPPAVQVSQAMSYPAELLQEWTTATVRKIMMSSKEAAQARQRKETVQRVGVSIGIRYSATYGFQWWLSPYFFLLPGVRFLWDVYESFMALLLSSMALMQRSDNSEVNRKDTEGESEQALWILALRNWAAAKTSSLGYSLYLSGNRLSGAVMVNSMPFFLPVLYTNRSSPDKTADIDGDPKGQGDLPQILVPEVDEASSQIREASTLRVAMGGVDEAEAELKTSTEQRQAGELLKACTA